MPRVTYTLAELTMRIYNHVKNPDLVTDLYFEGNLAVRFTFNRQVRYRVSTHGFVERAENGILSSWGDDVQDLQRGLGFNE